MSHSADIVIIGGGQAGPAVAWALERLDSTLNIILLESNPALASGASTASVEAFRSCWTPQCIAEQTRRSIHIFLNADDYLNDGAKDRLNIRQNGYLWLAFDEVEAEALRQSIALFHRWGLAHARYINGDEARRAFPWLPPRVVGARYDPLAGWLDSNALAYSFIRATRHTKVWLETTAQEIVVTNGRVTGVKTSKGIVWTRTVILAAGPGTRALGRTAGVDIPVVCIPRQSFWTPFRQANIPAHAPLVISRWPYAHFRPEGDGLLFAWSYQRRGEHGLQAAENYAIPRWPIESFKDPRYPELTLELLARQFGYQAGQGFRDPRYLTRRIAHNIGYYVYRTPVMDRDRRITHSERAILDRWPGIEGLILSIAHVGHGIMTAPAAGEIVAALVLGQEPEARLWRDFGLNVQSVPYEEGGGL